MSSQVPVSALSCASKESKISAGDLKGLLNMQVKLILLATSNARADQGVPNALAKVADVPVLNYWMESIKTVTRLQPLKDKVFIVANDHNHASLVAWASNHNLSGGFPLGNIINTRSRNTTSNLAADVSFAIQAAGLDDSHLVIASLEVLFKPHFNFQKIVEHSLIRAKDSVVFHRPPPGADMASYARLDIDDLALGVPNPRVLAVDTCPSGPADGIASIALAPIVVIRRGSLPDFIQASTSASVEESRTPASTQSRQLGALLQERLLGSGKQVYALEEDWCIDISSSAGLAFADGFITRQIKAEVTGEGTGSAAQALREVTQAAQDLCIVPRGDEAMSSLLDACSDNKKSFLEFVSGAEQEASDAGATLGKTGNGQLPARFAEPATRRHAPRSQNPMYTTSSNDYGLRKATVVDMPDTYAGSSQQFSNTFYGGPSKVSSMVTAVTTSKVHKALNDY